MNKRLSVILTLVLLAPIKTRAADLRNCFSSAIGLGVLLLVINRPLQADGPGFSYPIKVTDKRGKRMVITQNRAG